MFSSDSFKKLRQVRVEELSVNVSEFIHSETGAMFYHLDHSSADAFSIAFRTLPTDSTGLPHILEHTALCGSQKFPVRDPFFKMLNRSLAVYMNAWTGSDFTQYPFVTENSADYANLRSVYLDAVFKPLLEVDDFLQEGWRLVSSKDKGTGIGGVVYNEMKGALSDADSFFMTRFQQSRFGSESVYGVVSGGDPLEIPQLIHKDLVDFHSNFYHPSNSVAVSSGSQPVEENLRALQEYFKFFKRKDTDLSTLRALPSETTKKMEITGPIDPLGDPTTQTRLLVSFLACDSSNVQEAFNLKILCDLLFEGPASPFYHALIDSGLASEYAPGTGYDASTHRSTISVGLQGLEESKLETVERTIEEVFKQVRAAPDEFISRDRVETVLHQVELGLRYASANFGLSLVSSVTQSWIHGADPIASLSIAKKVTAFREQYEKGGLVGALLDKYILNNQSSRLCFIMRPDLGHAAKLEAHEKQFISDLNLSESQLEGLKRDSERLEVKQEEHQNLSCLPCLTIDQVHPEIRDKALRPNLLIESSNVQLYERKCSEANGLVYFKAAMKLDDLTDRQILLLPILLQCLSELGGAKRNSAAEFDSAVKRYTGGLGFSLHQGHLKYPCLSADLSLLISSYSLSENGDKMLELLQEALADSNFMADQDRIKMLIASSAAAMSSSIASSGNRFAALKAGSAFESERARVGESLNGLRQAHFLNDLANEPIEQVTTELCNLARTLTRIEKAALIHSNASDSFATDMKEFFASFSTVNINNVNTSSSQSTPTTPNLFIPGPFSSNFSAMSFMPFKDRRPSARESAILTITAKLLRSKHLHREIREKGGAYGSAASFSPLSGFFTFSSYRDPSPLNSLQVFRGAGRALQSRDSPSEEDLLGAKLSAFSDLDAPVDVSSRGLQEFLYGPEMGSDQRRQEYREALRSCSLANVHESIDSILNESALKEARVCVIGESGKIAEFENDPALKWAIENNKQ